MKQKFGRVVALALALVMVCGVVFVPAYAAAGAEGNDLTPAPVSEPQPEQTPQPESEEAPETPVTPETPKEETPGTSETPEAPTEETSETPEAPTEETSETPEAPKQDEGNYVIVPPAEEAPSILVPGEETLEQPEGAQTPENGETAPQTAQEYLSKISVYEGEYKYLNVQKQFGLITDEAYTEGCQALYLSLGELLAQAAEADTLTAEDLAQIEDAAAPLLAEVGQIIGADQPEMLAPPKPGGNKDRTFTFNLNGVELAYFYYLNDTNSGYEEPTVLTPETDNSFVKSQNDGNTRLLCFVKPAANHLLTSWSAGASGKFDFYGIGLKGKTSNISDFSGLSTYIQRMEKEGYLAYFGFTMSAVDKDFDCTITAKEPTMTVTATTDSTDVEIGDEVEFTVTITPGKTVDSDKIVSADIKKLQIDGRDVVYETPTRVGDSIVTKVKYTVTADDFAKRTVKLHVEAEIKYEHELKLKDRDNNESTVTTEATVNQTKNVDVAIVSNPHYVVSYEPDGETPSDDVISQTEAPPCHEYLQAGQPHTVLGYEDNDGNEYKTVDDPKKGGTWTFDGWYLNCEDGVLSGEHYNMGDPYTMPTPKEGSEDEVNVTFYGKWTFTANAVDVTIGKHVVGSMGDHNKPFKFTYAITKDGEDITPKLEEGAEEGAEQPNVFELANGGEKTLTGVPVGATITITEREDSRAGYETSYQIGSLVYDKDKAEQGSEIVYTVLPLETVTDEDGEVTTVNLNQILFINVKDIEPDTGISLDSLPYVLALALAVSGGVYLALRRRRGYSD